MKLLNPTLLPHIVQLPSPNRSRGRWIGPRGKKRRQRIELIVLHSTVGAFAGSVDWLRKRDRPNRTSAHYVVAKTGAIIQLVDEADSAWHAGWGRWGGRRGVNARSIGIELENRNDAREPYPRNQLETTLWLCVRDCKRYRLRVERVVGHLHVDPERKTDPAGFPWDHFRASLYDALAQP